MPHYTAFGLTFDAPFAVPELVELPAAGPPDVTIQLGPPGTLPARGPRVFTDEESFNFYPGIGAFRVRQGREIVLEPQPGADFAALKQILLGAMMSTLLHQRGYLALHACGVRLDGGASLFLGDSGAGKSTTAAAFAAQGYQISTDDLAALRRPSASSDSRHDPQYDPQYDPHYELLPGYPRTRLDAAHAPLLGHASAGWPLSLDTAGRRSYELNGRFCAEVLPVRRLYLLVDGPTLQIEPLAAPAALRALIEQSFVWRRSAPQAVRARHYQRCLELAKLLPLRQLTRPRNLAALPALVRLVAADEQA